MPDVELSYHDQEQLYESGLFEYKGDLVKVINTNNGKFSIKYLKTGKSQSVPFDPKHFKVPDNRIGMVNFNKSAFYIERKTIRQYILGPAPSNIRVHNLIGAPEEDDGLNYLKESMKKIGELELPCILDSYQNRYPSLIQAFEKAIETNGTVAFDKQFAIDCLGRVYYKWNQVGQYKHGFIDFIPKYSFCIILLEDCYEKTSRNFKATPIRR